MCDPAAAARADPPDNAAPLQHLSGRFVARQQAGAAPGARADWSAASIQAGIEAQKDELRQLLAIGSAGLRA